VELEAFTSFDEAARELARAAGRSQLALPEFITWKLRVLIEAGELAAAAVNAAPLPEGQEGSVQVVWERFLYLLAVRWAKDPGEPTTFSRSFAAAWCGLNEWEAEHATAELRRMGFIRTVGRHRQANLYLPKEAE
jgi:hypothetical protein